ncbi:hypothetical protein [Zhongshania aquimaris]|uniref:Uncharacterized protein n=1 Tax=Zhongshania aquimaris TaxID=2857107 RepID=A0ABS6VV15_9GAMM|nr:hypothetical protein [Zhongshania aquimaris]MBW2942136.1 hypothetical protein [Zhongshania aquimaris]
MLLRICFALLLSSPTISFAADCEDREIFTGELLTRAITQLVQNYGESASKQAISRCESGPGSKRQIKLAAHEQDDNFTYYRMVSCDQGRAADDVSCKASEGRRIKYQGTTIDTDSAAGDSDKNAKFTENYLRALDCFSAGLQAGTVKARKYNRLLDTTLDIPLPVDSVINSIHLLPGFQRYIINAGAEHFRFSVELDKEYGCFIEVLK